MKISYYFSILATVGVLASSCSNKYDDAISEYVQTIEGTKVDLECKIKEAKEVRQITVADSISIINFNKEAAIKFKITEAEAELTKLQENFVLEETKAGTKSKILTAAFIRAIDIKQAQLDSLKGIKQTAVEQYEGRKATDVLAIVVEARYTVKNPQLDNGNAEITNQFVLTPDGKKCLAELGPPITPIL